MSTTCSNVVLSPKQYLECLNNSLSMLTKYNNPCLQDCMCTKNHVCKEGLAAAAQVAPYHVRLHVTGAGVQDFVAA